jgi:hypothetical protein
VILGVSSGETLTAREVPTVPTFADHFWLCQGRNLNTFSSRTSDIEWKLRRICDSIDDSIQSCNQMFTCLDDNAQIETKSVT